MNQLTPAATLALLSGDENNFLAAMPGGIEAQEKRGQLEQATLQTLPKDTRDKPLFEKLGFVFGKEVNGIFLECTFPPGWSKKPRDHAMWSDILDDKGRKRGGIFYKAAFYDQRANARLDRRFSVDCDYDSPNRDWFIRDACGLVNERRPGTDDFRAEQHLENELEDWLKANYPDCENPLAYWD